MDCKKRRSRQGENRSKKGMNKWTSLPKPVNSFNLYAKVPHIVPSPEDDHWLLRGIVPQQLDIPHLSGESPAPQWWQFSLPWLAVRQNPHRDRASLQFLKGSRSEMEFWPSPALPHVPADLYMCHVLGLSAHAVQLL